MGTALILGTIAVTSLLSGVLGMGGGIILMGVLTLALPVASAMVVHGVTQLAANASRAFVHRRYIDRRVIAPYVAGAALAAAAFAGVGVVAEPAVIYLLLGLFPFAGVFLPAMRRLDVTKRAHAVACGAVVCALQLLAGASGPVLDVFFLGAPLDKRSIVATKAATQALGHSFKLAYYGWVIASGGAEALAVAPWLLAVAVALAVLGSVAGGRLLERLSDAAFQKACRALVLAVGAVYLVKGALALARIAVT